jgi:membrane fusion protein (multidrug efflux system)
MRLLARAAASLLLATAVASEARAQPASGPGAPPGVVVAEARVVTFPLSVEGLGTARARESIEVRPAISERITEIRFEEGQRVEVGDVLVVLESRELRAAVASARAAVVESEGNLRRARKLRATNALSAAELEAREARRDADRAALDAAQARLAQASVRAPFAGRLGLRRVSPGSFVTPDTVITTLDDTATIKLDFDVPETSLSRLAEGLPVRARSAAWPERPFEGTVASIDTRVDPVSRTITVRALVDNADGRLRPGMFLTVSLLREDVTALVVPEQAIVPSQSTQSVWVVGPGGEVERRVVRTGRRRPGQVAIESGLSPGELVIAEGTQKVVPGARVEILGRIEVEGTPPPTRQAHP